MQESLFITTKKAMKRRKGFLKNIQRLKTFGMQNETIFWLEDKREKVIKLQMLISAIHTI